MGTIKIGGKTYVGTRISIVDNVITIDGKPVEAGHPYVINVEGSVDVIDVDMCEKIVVGGSARMIKTMSGNVECGDVAGNVQTMSGDIKCKSIAGDASSMSGDVG